MSNLQEVRTMRKQELQEFGSYDKETAIYEIEKGVFCILYYNEMVEYYPSAKYISVN